MRVPLEEQIPLVAGASNGIKKLRELIFALAVRGKLVAQNHLERPAIELLREIAEVKGKSQEKEKRPGTRSPEPARVDGPHRLPESWSWATPEQISSDIVDCPHSTPKFVAQGVLCVDTNSFKQGQLVGHKLRYVDEQTYQQRIARLAPQAGDIVFAREGSVGESLVIPSGVKCCLGQRVMLFRPCLVNPDYFRLALSEPGALSRQLALHKGIGAKHVNVSDMRVAQIPLPPLPEQHRIVAKVDELMALCDRLEAEQADAEAAHAKLVEALLASLTQARDAGDFRASWQQLTEHFHTLFTTEASVDALKKTIVHLAVMGKLVAPVYGEPSASDFLAEIDVARTEYEATPGLRSRQRVEREAPMVTPPYPAPIGWEWRNLSSLLLITGGVTLGRKLAGREVVALPYLRVANVQRGFLVLDQVKEVEVPADEVEKYKLVPGDLLTTEGGDWDKVGRTAIWRGEIAQCLHQNHVFRLRPYTDKFNSRWVELYLNSPPARDYFAGSSKQTTNLASINMTQLRACAFPVPPLAEQQQIVAVVDNLLKRCDQLIASMAISYQRHEHLASVLVEQAVA